MEPIDLSACDPAERILELTGGRGADASVDAVGFEAKGSATETALTTLKIETSSGASLRQCIAATRRCGTVAVPGVYAGYLHGFMLGDAFDKALRFTMGQTHVQRHLPKLLEHVENGDLQPEAIISHRMKLADAARGYEMFEGMEDECRKVVLTP